MKSRTFCRLALLALAIPFLTLSTANASVTLYTDLAAFNADLALNGYPSQLSDFESVTAGTTYPTASTATIEGITYDFDSPDLLVTDDFATTSGANYLGMDSVGLANQFIGGYRLDMTFTASNAIGLSIITGEIPNLSIFDDDIQLIVGANIALLDVDDLQGTVGGSDSVFFLGIIDTMQTFSSAQIGYANAAIGTITYNIDDVRTASIPEPQTALIMLVVGGWVCSRRNQRTS